MLPSFFTMLMFPARRLHASASIGVGAEARRGAASGIVLSERADLLSEPESTSIGADVLSQQEFIGAKAGADVLSEQEFVALANDASARSGHVDLAGRRVELAEPFVLRGGSRLRIANGTVFGSGHAIFQVGVNRGGLLELDDVELLHGSSPARTAKRSLGAALLVRGKSRVSLRRCAVSSEAGFGIWLVQQSPTLLEACAMPASGRSSVVVFDDARVECVSTAFDDATPHAICARGKSSVAVRGCTLSRSADRAIYCYHSASLDVSDSAIRGTRNKHAPAVQVDAMRPGDAATLTLARTTFEGNAGGDLAVTGNVARHVCGEVRVREVAAESFGFASASVRDAQGDLRPQRFTTMN